MNTLTSTIAAVALALSLSGFAFAADEPPAGGQPSAQQGQGGGDATQREQEYLAALKKCDPLAGAEKQKCVDAAKKKYGQM